MKYEIRQLDLGGVLDQTIKLLTNHFGFLIGVTGLVLFPVTLALNLYVQFSAPEIPAVAPNPQDFEEAFAAGMAQSGVSLTAFYASLFVQIFLTPLVNAAMIHAIAALYLGRTVSLASAYSRAVSVYFPILITGILYSLAAMIGFVLCIIPGIFVLLWLTFYSQVVVLEGVSYFAALNRSRELMRGNMLTMLVLVIIFAVINGSVSVVTLIIPVPVVQAVLGAVIGTLGTLITTTGVVVLYFSARCQHEGFDLNLLASAVESEGG